MGKDSQPLTFIKGDKNILSDLSNEADKIRKITEHFINSFGAQNLSFLLGSGCSSLVSEGIELGIPTMGPLAKEYFEKRNKDFEEVFNKIKIDLTKYGSNLEQLMNVLFSASFYFSETGLVEERKFCLEIIDNIKDFLIEKCFKENFLKYDHEVTKIYQMFYRKLSYRGRNLNRPWIFTTNYDLFNELALDLSGIPFTNGFSGVIERCFNPATFRFSLMQELGLSNKKWATLDAYIYLCKLHGSINWIEKESGLYSIKEVQNPKNLNKNDRIMIYPTPLKQNSSFSSPYSDLFREFQSKLLSEQSVLFCLGYGFGDEHVNNIIYRALTIPSFRLIILANPNASGEIKKLRELNDPRIWIIGGHLKDKGEAHYFSNFVKELLPGAEEDSVKSANEKIIETLFSVKTQNVKEEME